MPASEVRPTVYLFEGHRVHALEPIECIGLILGLKRGKAFRAAESWPLHGSKGERRVVVPALAAQLGLPCPIVEPEPEQVAS